MGGWEVGRKDRCTMRIMMGNMMGMGAKQEGQEEKLHTLTKVLGVDVMGVADTKVWKEREGAGRRHEATDFAQPKINSHRATMGARG